MGTVVKSVIYEVATNSPAAMAGLRKGDEIIALNGETIYSPVAVMYLEDSMTNGVVSPAMMTIRRGAE